jgi:hypothetical protein
MAALLHNNVAAGSSGYHPSKLQPQSNMVLPDTMPDLGYYMGDPSPHMLTLQQQQQSGMVQPDTMPDLGYYMGDPSPHMLTQQQQQQYADASLQQQQQVMASASAAHDYSTVQPAPQPQYAAWPHLAPLQVKQEQQQPQQPGLLSPFDQQAKAPWDAITAADGAAEVAGDAATAAPATGSFAWLYSSDTQQHQQQQQSYKTEQQYHQDQGQQQFAAAAAAGQMLAPAPLQPKQEQQPKQEADGKSLSPAKGRPLPLELPTDPYAHFFKSPREYLAANNLLSPELQLPPISCRGVAQQDRWLPTPSSTVGMDWQTTYEALLNGPSTGRQFAAPAADAAYSNPRSARPSDNGGSLLSPLAGWGALGAAPRTGKKRARSSQTSWDDEAGELIDAPATKVARGGEAPAEGGLYGCDSPWATAEEGFLPKFD